MTTFILADNQDITRAGLHYYLSLIALDHQERAVANKNELLAALKGCNGKAVVILDYTLSDLQNIEELLIIGKRFPDSRWLLFSNELSESLIRRMAAEPDVSLLLKECPSEEITAALKCIIKGERYLCHQIANLLLTRTSKPSDSHSLLTPTEVDILKLVAQGKSVKEIAQLRTSSIHTIITHKKNIFRKLEVNNVHEATKYALRAGLIEMMEYYI